MSDLLEELAKARVRALENAIAAIDLAFASDLDIAPQDVIRMMIAAEGLGKSQSDQAHDQSKK